MKKYVLISIIIMIFVLVGVYISQQYNEKNILGVRLQVLAPFSNATLIVSNQGIIRYEASALDAGIDMQTDVINITTKQFKELADLINKNDFWSFNREYIDSNIVDATTYIVTVSSVQSYSPELADASVNPIKCYGNCPEKILEIINKIKEMWGKKILEVGA